MLAENGTSVRRRGGGAASSLTSKDEEEGINNVRRYLASFYGKHSPERANDDAIFKIMETIFEKRISPARFRAILAEKYGAKSVQDFPLETFQKLEQIIALRHAVPKKKSRIREEEEDEGFGFVGLMIVTVLVFMIPICLVFGREMMNNVETQVNVNSGYGPPTFFPLHLKLEEVYAGGQFETPQVSVKVACGECSGTGADDRFGMKICDKCNGQGVTSYVQNFGGFRQRMRSVCNTCEGEGQLIARRCAKCKGRKVQTDKKRHVVEVERGMGHDDQIVVAGQGEETYVGRRANLVFELQIARHSRFRRDGDILHYNLKVTLLEALTGFRKEIVHLDGRVIVVEPQPGSVVAPGSVYVIQGEGMPIRKSWSSSSFGDLHIHYDVVIPRTLTAEQKQVLHSTLP